LGQLVKATGGGKHDNFVIVIFDAYENVPPRSLSGIEQFGWIRRFFNNFTPSRIRRRSAHYWHKSCHRAV
jgi:hypothetical protein